MSFSIYPNPSHGKLNILNNDCLGIDRLSIIQNDGKVVKTIAHQFSDLISIDILDLPDGSYFIETESGRRKIIDKFILKK